MDIALLLKKRHAFILSVIDAFTNVLMGRKTAYNIKQNLVKQLWEEIIENYLQPYDCLNQKMQIEIRNDNDSRSVADSVQKFFKDNHLQQVFTHPYTPSRIGILRVFMQYCPQCLSVIASGHWKIWSNAWYFFMRNTTTIACTVHHCICRQWYFGSAIKTINTLP